VYVIVFFCVYTGVFVYVCVYVCACLNMHVEKKTRAQRHRELLHKKKIRERENLRGEKAQEESNRRCACIQIYTQIKNIKKY